MDIAGHRFPLSSTQTLEVLIVLTIIEFFRHAVTKIISTSAHAEAKSGRIRPESMPTILSHIITPIHGIAIISVPLMYAVQLALNGFTQPDCMARFALPELESDHLVVWKNTSRVLACVASISLGKFVDDVFYHLGDQWHTIGRREKPRVVKTGPYAWVRHPLYAVVLVQEVLWCIMFWSYAPLVALGIIAGAFAVKMPIEEEAIQQDDGIGEEYKAYMKQVPARIVPYIW